MTSPSRTIRFVSVVALLNVAALVVLGQIAQHALHRTEVNTHRIEVNAYETCRGRDRNIARLNALYAGMIEIERANPFAKTSPETIKARIDLYTQAHLTSLPCGPKP